MLLLLTATSVAFAARHSNSLQPAESATSTVSANTDEATSTAHDAVSVSTYEYAIKDADTLRLDCYTIPEKCTQARPAYIFAFGGSFKTGDRAAKQYIPCFEFLAREGYAVFSIDYRTGLSRPEIAGNIDSVETFFGALTRAVDIAVEDLYDATAYVVSNADSFGIDPQQIVISGSSAGAIAALQSEFYIANHHPLAARLPEGFNYAGVVSFAGAILAPGTPQWSSTPCPIMLFHGDADPTVPFSAAAIEGFGGLFGSQSIASSLADKGAAYSFYVIENANHSVATTPMTANLYNIMQFLTSQVANHLPLQTTTTERITGAEPVKKDFTITDYLQNNM